MPLTIGRPRRSRWPDDRARRFVSDWNGNLPSSALREKYGVRSPAAIATMLRDRGWTLAARQRGEIAR